MTSIAVLSTDGQRLAGSYLTGISFGVLTISGYNMIGMPIFMKNRLKLVFLLLSLIGFSISAFLVSSLNILKLPILSINISYIFVMIFELFAIPLYFSLILDRLNAAMKVYTNLEFKQNVLYMFCTIYISLFFVFFGMLVNGYNLHSSAFNNIDVYRLYWTNTFTAFMFILDLIQLFSSVSLYKQIKLNMQVLYKNNNTNSGIKMNFLIIFCLVISLTSIVFNILRYTAIGWTIPLYLNVVSLSIKFYELLHFSDAVYAVTHPSMISSVISSSIRSENSK